MELGDLIPFGSLTFPDSSIAKVKEEAVFQLCSRALGEPPMQVLVLHASNFYASMHRIFTPACIEFSRQPAALLIALYGTLNRREDFALRTGGVIVANELHQRSGAVCLAGPPFN